MNARSQSSIHSSVSREFFAKTIESGLRTKPKLRSRSAVRAAEVSGGPLPNSVVDRWVRLAEEYPPPPLFQKRERGNRRRPHRSRKRKFED